MRDTIFKSDIDHEGMMAASLLEKDSPWGGSAMEVDRRGVMEAICTRPSYSRPYQVISTGTSEESRELDVLYKAAIVELFDATHYWVFDPCVADIETEFNNLYSEWKRDTILDSNVSNIATHPAYQRIIGMGAGALPYIFRALRADADHWFWALRSITGVNPVPPEYRGDIARMREFWLDWGKVHGL